MDYDKALSKIKKCLALAASANEYEAANALRQAQALMQRYNIEHGDVLASEISVASIKSRSHKQPAAWENKLVIVIRHAFGCEAIFSSQKEPRQAFWQFIGEGSAPEIAKYAYEIIHRQVSRGRRVFIAENCKDYPPRIKKRMVDLYSQAWLEGLWERVKAFAKAGHQSEALKAYMERHHSDIDGQVTTRGVKRLKKIKSHEALAIYSGLNAAKQTQLHYGVPTEQQGLLK